ncbi:alpha/beta fold hydrolase [Protaetiibacter sp. SSC-01]|uniref:alpha/beta hydrolase family protein n=1 Tax=Protaetiibacter sp. SSC-01 TaxID=2759943 RepID=UPI00165691ED|nr:alpha/beta hydrolase [Protaetiibacter sp. SSC-01]QNO37634.1 alpha/beta fold hydrolase [Protaetiibacter sp. SSC-01]
MRTNTDAAFAVEVPRGRVVGRVRMPESAPSGVVVIHPATATPERFYAAFAGYATSRGLAAVTYDLHGTGASGDPREHRGTRMRDWMSEDVPAVAAWTREQFPGLPLSAVGHSIGGHAMVLGYGLEGVSRFATVASHVASTRRIASLGERMRVAAILNVVGPGLSRALGYMPGRRLGLGEDMPAAAMIEWGRWSRHDGYFFDDPTMGAAEAAARVTVPALMVGASDDPWASPRQVDALAARLESAAPERRTFTPDELGVAKVGHHGLLRRGVGERAWPELLDWLTDGRPA